MLKYTLFSLMLGILDANAQDNYEPEFDIMYDGEDSSILGKNGIKPIPPDHELYPTNEVEIYDGYGPYGGDYYDMYDTEFMKELNKTENEITIRRVLVPTVYCIIAVVGFVLCPLAVIISQRTKNLQYSQRIFLQNLCVASFLVCLNIPISAVSRATNWWYFGTIVCKIHNCLSNYTLLSQAFFAVALCYDYVMLKLKPSFRERKRTLIEIVTLEFGWLISLAFSFPMLFHSEEKYGRCTIFFQEDIQEEKVSKDSEDYDTEFNANGNMLNMTLPVHDMECKILDSQVYFKRWIICSFVFSFALPLIALVIAYIVYCCHKRRQAKRTNGVTDNELSPSEKVEEDTLLDKNVNNNNNPTEENRIVVENNAFVITGKWVAFIGISYFFCWFPLHVYHLGRIPGLDLSLTSCRNLRDYAFVQGYLSALLFPFMTICYCKPDLMKISKARANIKFTKPSNRDEGESSQKGVNLLRTSDIQTV